MHINIINNITQAAKHYMYFMNCIYIDSETNYFMILIKYKSPKQFSLVVYQSVCISIISHQILFDRKKQVPFSMAIGVMELKNKCFPIMHMETVSMK